MVFERITIDPAHMNGQPCIRGMRLTVRRVLDIVATYGSGGDEIRTEFPELEPDDIREALAYAAASLDDQIVELRPAS